MSDVADRGADPEPDPGPDPGVSTDGDGDANTEGGTEGGVPRRMRWGAWVLAVVAVAQPLVAVAAAVSVLSGSLDARYFSTYEVEADGTQSTSIQPGVTFWQRWTVMTFTVPVDRALLGPTAVVVALAVVHLASRRPLPRGVRWTAVGAAGLSALLALTSAVALLVLQTRPDEETGFYSSRSGLVDLGAPFAASALTIVFGVLAALVLLGPVAPLPPPPADTGPRSAPRPDTEPAPEPEPAPGVRDETGQDEDGQDEEDPGPSVPVPAGLPTPSPEEYAWYRRPPA